MVDVNAITKILARLSLLNFFPTEPEARTALLELVCERKPEPTEEQVQWVVNRVLELHRDWPGPAALLQLFGSPMMPGNMKPLSEADRQKVLGAASDQKLIGAGAENPKGMVSADPLVQTAFEVLMQIQELKERAWDRPADPEEIALAPEWLRKLEDY